MNGGFTIRHLGAFRGNKNTSLERLRHEVFHTEKERSAEKVEKLSDYSEYLFGGVALIYATQRIRKEYVGDVWTVRVKTNPMRVRRTKPSNTYRGYDECIVKGLPYGVLIRTKLFTKEIKLFCKQNNLKVYFTENL